MMERDFYQLLKTYLRDIIQLDYVKRSLTKERATYLLEDGAEVMLRVSIERKGYENGEFGVYTGFMVSGGRIVDIINSSTSTVKFCEPVLASDTSFSFIKRLHAQSYHITAANYADQCKRIVQDMQEAYVPVVQSLVWKPDYAVANFDALEYYKFIARNRFTVGVTLAYLAETPQFIDELMTMATVSKPVGNFDRRDYFSDYRSVSDPYEEIITPIRLAIEGITS